MGANIPTTQQTAQVQDSASGPAATIRYGIIGAGQMAREHVRNLGLIPGSQVTALCDPHPESLDLTHAEVMGLPNAPDAVARFEHVGQLLASGLVDALLIASPNDTHIYILGKIFAHPHPYPVLEEKPVCKIGRAHD